MTTFALAILSMISSSFDVAVLTEGLNAGGTLVHCNGKGADIETASGFCIVGLSDDRVQAVDSALQAKGMDMSGCIHGRDGICLM